jgi:CheY-like chemotaxis protein
VAESIPRGHEHILFVDDEAILVHLGQELLTRLGYTVTGHTGGIEALTAF